MSQNHTHEDPTSVLPDLEKPSITIHVVRTADQALTAHVALCGYVIHPGNGASMGEAAALAAKRCKRCDEISLELSFYGS